MMSQLHDRIAIHPPNSHSAIKILIRQRIAEIPKSCFFVYQRPGRYSTGYQVDTYPKNTGAQRATHGANLRCDAGDWEAPSAPFEANV